VGGTLKAGGNPITRNDASERWTVHGNGLAGRLDSWSEILASTHLSFEIKATHRTPAAFAGGVTRRVIDDLTLLDCAASPFMGNRGIAEIGAGGPSAKENVLGFMFVVKGVEIVREGGRERTLTPGQMVMWDGLQPTGIEIVKPFYKRTLLFPRDRVLAICPRLAELRALPPIDGSGPARLLVRYMNAIASELPLLDRAGVSAAATAALELLRATVEPGLPTGRAAERAAMRADIRRYVRAHLQDPDLGPTSIAQAFAMSVRALHALFEDGEASVAVLVRNERLTRCLEDLRRRNGGSVTDVAFRWGFCDAAHFSRVFKRQYGVTPSDVRHGALVEGESAIEVSAYAIPSNGHAPGSSNGHFPSGN
jgi:AraC family transcriptional regulator, positive regulator of tynA and feaB